jgi:hypothetical protein
MFASRLFNLLIVAALMMITACAPGVASTSTSAPTVTYLLASSSPQADVNSPALARYERRARKTIHRRSKCLQIDYLLCSLLKL